MHMKSEINFETSDLMEMLENLKTSFKLGHSMDIVEEKIDISTHDVVLSICKTHKKLAINGCNAYKVQVEKFFPKHLHIQKTLFKRVVNNIISNSLKHTYCGVVQILFTHTDKVYESCATFFDSEYIHVGSDYIVNEN